MNAAVKQGAGYTLFVLFLINFLNFFDRAIPAVVMEPLRQEFGLTDTLLGLLTTSFTLIYALAGIPLGRLSDKHPRTRILSFGVAVWSGLTAASGAAFSAMSFFFARLGVGVGEASCAPAANSLIGDLYPSEKRARAVGIFMLGLPLGSMACFAVVGHIAQNYGWRAPFFFAAVPGLIVALMAWFLIEPARGAQEAKPDAAVTVDRPFRRILSIPTVWWIIASGASYNFASYAMNTFLGAMLMRYHGLKIAEASGIASIVLGATGLITLTLGAWVADRVHRAHPRGRLLLGALCLLAAAPLVWLGLNQATGETRALTQLLAGGWLLFFMYYVTVYSALQDVIEPRLRATAMSVYFLFMYVFGGGLGTFVAGMLSDHYAHQAMAAAGGSEITAAFRAVGLQQSLALSVPVAILITGITLCFAAQTFVKDASKNLTR